MEKTIGIKEKSFVGFGEDLNLGVVVKNNRARYNSIANLYLMKHEIAKELKSEANVKKGLDEMDVNYEIVFERTDKEIEKVVANILAQDKDITEDNISIKVYRGLVYLSGEVHRYSEKIKAKKVIEKRLGIHKVVNNITLREAVRFSF